MSMSGFCRRSLSHRYHSLGADVNVAGKCLVAGCARSSTRSIADVGRHVLLTYEPAPRNVLWYQSQSAGYADGVNAKPAKWKPIQAPPCSMYVRKAARCAGSSGRGIQKYHDLILRQKPGVEVAP